jgi:SAM-dependent methyltransferase
MKLSIGCGTDIRKGYVNLDCAALPGVDVVHDLDKLPLPFKDSQFEEILAKDVLEHVDYIPLLKELLRIMKPGATLIATVPHWTSTNMYTDPQHKHFFAIRTFGFFCKESPYLKSVDRSYYTDFHFSSHKARITFPRHFPWDRINEWLVNIHPKVQVFYELTFWSRLCPAENVFVELVK